MHIPIWSDIEPFLVTEKKLKDVKGARSRHKILCGFFGQKNLVSRQDIYTFFTYLRNNKSKPGYLNNFIKHLHHLDQFGGTKDMDDFSHFTVTRESRDVLDPIEIQKMYKMEPPTRYPRTIQTNERYSLIIEILGRTGMRIGELLALTRADISNDTITIRNSKTHQSRQVPICASLADRIFKQSPCMGPVFTISPQKINEELKLRAKLCSIEKLITCHTFRRSYITTMLNEGIDAILIAKIVGHDNLNTTFGYSYLAIDQIRNVVARHPLEMGEVTPNQVREQLKSFVSKFRFSQFPISYQEDTNTVGLTINLSPH